MTKLIAVVTTVATLDDAREMARALVERKLVACAQIEQIESFYEWDGQVNGEPEQRLLLKTTDDRYAEVEAAIREMHGYALPAIWSLPVTHAFGPYAEWVEKGSAGG
jgi:periplasmic divalent cation tolerance protein